VDEFHGRLELVVRLPPDPIPAERRFRRSRQTARPGWWPKAHDDLSEGAVANFAAHHMMNII
jgi:hypothetical protein